MCVGIPMRLKAIDGIAGSVETEHGEGLIDLSLTPDVRKGDWVLCFLGAAREIVSAEEAAKIQAAFDGLKSVMEGNGLGDAFADLEASGPRLPAHLQAAVDAGETIA